MTSSDRRATERAAAQREIDDIGATFARGEIDHEEWQRQVADTLAAAYLSDDDPRWQSGFDGDEDLWREARSLVLDAVTAAGTFLDVGCANGYLMERLEAWARERGVALEMHGLELQPALADLARRRLPHWAGRIATGNVTDWSPPQRFAYVRTGLEYVAPGQGPALVTRVLRDLVAPGGRLIVGPVYESDVSATVDAFRAAGVPDPGVVSGADRNGKTRYAVWATSPG